MPLVDVRMSRQAPWAAEGPACCGGKVRGWVLFSLAVAAAGCMAVWAWHKNSSAVGAPPQQSPEQMKVERGKYLVAISGCSDCHTPFKMTDKGPAPDLDRMLSGHPEQLKMPPAPKPQGPWLWTGAATNTAFAGPWGVTYAANLTPDKNTGLGIWTEEMFVNALKTGKHWGQPGARPIMPPMPVQSTAQMTTDDLKAMWAYLRTIPAVRNQVPDYHPPE